MSAFLTLDSVSLAAPDGRLLFDGLTLAFGREQAVGADSGDEMPPRYCWLRASRKSWSTSSPWLRPPVWTWRETIL